MTGPDSTDPRWRRPDLEYVERDVAEDVVRRERLSDREFVAEFAATIENRNTFLEMESPRFFRIVAEHVLKGMYP